jgi:Ras family protein T1
VSLIYRGVRLLLICLSVQVPVILVGNKIDLRGGAVTNEALEEEIAPLMRDFKVSITAVHRGF